MSAETFVVGTRVATRTDAAEGTRLHTRASRPRSRTTFMMWVEPRVDEDEDKDVVVYGDQGISTEEYKKIHMAN